MTCYPAKTLCASDQGRDCAHAHDRDGVYHGNGGRGRGSEQESLDLVQIQSWIQLAKRHSSHFLLPLLSHSRCYTPWEGTYRRSSCKENQPIWPGGVPCLHHMAVPARPGVSVTGEKSHDCALESENGLGCGRDGCGFSKAAAEVRMKPFESLSS